MKPPKSQATTVSTDLEKIGYILESLRGETGETGGDLFRRIIEAEESTSGPGLVFSLVLHHYTELWSVDGEEGYKSGYALTVTYQGDKPDPRYTLVIFFLLDGDELVAVKSEAVYDQVTQPPRTLH